MFNVITFLDKHPEKLSDRARAEIRDIKEKHEKLMIQKGYSDHIRKEKPLS